MNKISRRENVLRRLVFALSLLLSCQFALIAQAEDTLSDVGVGPIKKLELKPIDNALAAHGKDVFAAKCSACHKVGSRYVGPDLAGVTKRRSPEWIMNMILNPQEMIQKNPVAQDLFGEFLVPMTFQNVVETDARAIVEYFREHDSKEHDSK